MKKAALLLAAMALPSHASDDKDVVKAIITFCDSMGIVAEFIIQERQDGKSATDAYKWAEENGGASKDVLFELTGKAYLEPLYSAESQQMEQATRFRNEAFQQCIASRTK